MKEKTAMQELLEHMETHMLGSDPVYKHARILLEKEKEQIEESYNDGHLEMGYKTFEEYYKDKYE